MELIIETTPENITTLMMDRRRNRLSEFAEELLELQKLNASRNRGAIAEKLAELEYQINCIQYEYFRKEKFVIKDTGRYDLRLSAITFSDLVSIYISNGRHFFFGRVIEQMTRHICQCLYNIYDDYDITFDETRKIRERNLKRQRNEIHKKNLILIGENR